MTRVVSGRLIVEAFLKTGDLEAGANRAGKALGRVKTHTDNLGKAQNLQTRSSRKGLQAMLGLSQGVEDFGAVFQTTGLAGGIRASANNMAQVATTLHPLAGVITGVTVGLGMLAMGFLKSGNAAKKSAERIDFVAQSINRYKAALESAAQRQKETKAFLAGPITKKTIQSQEDKIQGLKDQRADQEKLKKAAGDIFSKHVLRTGSDKLLTSIGGGLMTTGGVAPRTGGGFSNLLQTRNEKMLTALQYGGQFGRAQELKKEMLGPWRKLKSGEWGMAGLPSGPATEKEKKRVEDIIASANEQRYKGFVPNQLKTQLGKDEEFSKEQKTNIEAYVAAMKTAQEAIEKLDADIKSNTKALDTANKQGLDPPKEADVLRTGSSILSARKRLIMSDPDFAAKGPGPVGAAVKGSATAFSAIEAAKRDRGGSTKLLAELKSINEKSRDIQQKQLDLMIKDAPVEVKSLLGI